MTSIAPILFKRTLLTLGLFLLALGSLLFFDHRPILIESEESKTVESQPVYNQISFQPGIEEDIWMMQQSHKGLKPAVHTWDRIAIKVDKTVSPKIAEYYQLMPGDLTWREDLQKIDFMASCFTCHTNGPRAIRPNYASKDVKISFYDQARLLAWNLRIKSYGRVVSYTKERKGARPFRHTGRVANAPLPFKSCTKCHTEEGFFARGTLTRQNAMTIHFMIENGHMPPPGFELPAEEKKEILDFLSGV